MYEKLPQELKETARFCLWRKENCNGKQTKVPYWANGHKGNSTDEGAFTDFKIVCSVVNRYDSIGMGIFDRYCAVDIDRGNLLLTYIMLALNLRLKV